jgi:TM2 domain-containing membrane protein YozV
MNYSLYRKTESDEDTESFFTKFLIFFIGIPLGLFLMPLTLFFPDPTEAVALKTMDFSTIPGSFTRKLPLKKREIYTFLGLYLGFLGLHNFYAGKVWKGILQLLLSVLLGILIVPLIISLLWAWIELASGKDAPTIVETI